MQTVLVGAQERMRHERCTLAANAKSVHFVTWSEPDAEIGSTNPRFAEAHSQGSRSKTGSRQFAPFITPGLTNEPQT
jgi:hypothetical protein